MTEIDAYMLQCSLDALQEGVKPELIEEECACRMGLKVRDADKETIFKTSY